MINEMSEALEGINLKLLPEKCSALWSEAPAGTEAENKPRGQKHTNRRGTGGAGARNFFQKRLHALVPTQT